MKLEERGTGFGQCRAYAPSRRWARVAAICARVAVLLALAACSRAAAQQVVYAIGVPPHAAAQTARVFVLEAPSLRIQESAPLHLGWSPSGALIQRGQSLLLSDGLSRLTLFSPALKPLKQAVLSRRAIDCFDHVFFNPLNSEAYFSCGAGKSEAGVAVVTVPGLRLLRVLHPASVDGSSEILNAQFLLDGARQRLYLAGGDLAALDSANRQVFYWTAASIARGAHLPGAGQHAFAVQRAALLPSGRLVLRLSDGSASSLVLVDPGGKKVLRSWSDTQKVTSYETVSDPRTGEPLPKRPVRRLEMLDEGPVASPDGLAVFAASGAQGLLFDAKTLKLMKRWRLPDTPAVGVSREGQGFFPAPDGHSMWFPGASGKIFRLDAHTGAQLGAFDPPFRLLALIPGA